MKKYTKLFITALTTCALLTSGLSVFNNEGFAKANALTLPNDINVSDTSETSIRNYYSAASGKKGKELLTTLKTILSNNHESCSYSQVWNAYMITDRDWKQSPLSASQLSNYTYNDNPYLVLLYRTDNYTATAAHINDDHNSVINREHVWAKSIGNFDTSAPAGTDLHHLIAADVDNNGAHSNFNFGEPTTITKTGGQIGKKDYNKTGKLGTVSYDGSSYTVYEPQDCDKGDIARALFYMAARYSSYTSKSDPYLELVDYPTSDSTYTSSATKPGRQGTISTLLKWHKQDPVDNYEIHRNNLIYNNYQNNRNPFIDYPELADIAFNSSYTNTFDPATQEVSVIDGGGVIPPVTKLPTSLVVSNQTTKFISGSPLSLGSGTLTVNYDDGSSKNIYLNDSNLSISINGNTYSKGVGLTPTETGTVTLTYTESGVSKSTSYQITVTKAVESISISGSTHYLKVGNSLNLTANVLPTDATERMVSWYSKNNEVATVGLNNGTVTGVMPGHTVITARSNDGSNVEANYDLYIYGLDDNEINAFHEFDKIEGFSSWKSTRSEHIVEYDDCKVVFDSANKSSSTISDIPVTADKNNVTVVAKNDFTIQSVEFICRQWANKTCSISLSYSTNNFEYTSIGSASKYFNALYENLPNGTTAVRVGFSSNSQVGFQALRIKYREMEVPPLPPDTPTLVSLSFNDTKPNKVEYKLGDTFDPTGIVVTANYDDGTSKDVTDKVTWNYGVLDATIISSVTCSYTENNVTKIATYIGITVTKDEPTPEPPIVDPTKDDVKVPVGAIVGISVGAIVLVAAVVVIILIIKKKHK